MMEQEKTLFEALGIFIKKMRSVFQTLCLREFGVNWEHLTQKRFVTIVIEIYGILKLIMVKDQRI